MTFAVPSDEAGRKQLDADMRKCDYFAVDLAGYAVLGGRCRSDVSEQGKNYLRHFGGRLRVFGPYAGALGDVHFDENGKPIYTRITL